MPEWDKLKDEFEPSVAKQPWGDLKSQFEPKSKLPWGKLGKQFEATIDLEPIEVIARPEKEDPHAVLSKIETIAPPESFDFIRQQYRLGKRKVMAVAEAFERGALLGYTPLTDRLFPEGFKAERPGEKFIQYPAEVAGFAIPFAVGAGAASKTGSGLLRILPWLSKVPRSARLIAKGTAIGTVLGAAEKPEEGETRLAGAARGGITFGVLSGLGVAGQKFMAKRGAKYLNKILGAADDLEGILPKTIRQAALPLTEQNAKALQVLSRLKPKEKNIVLNIVKGRRGFPVKQGQTWWEKNVGGPAYIKTIEWLNNRKSAPAEAIKKKLVFRYGQPEEWANAAENRILQIALGRDKSKAVGQLLSDSLNQHEAEMLMRDLGLKDPDLVGKIMRDTPLSVAESKRIMQMMKGGLTTGIRPDLQVRAEIARNTIDKLSAEITQMPMPDKTKQEILDNMGSYVRRFYTSKEGQSGIRKFFGSRDVKLKGKQTFLKRRAKSIKEAFVNDIAKEQAVIRQQIQQIRPKAIKGIGGIANERLKRAGLGNIQALSNATPTEVSQRLGVKMQKAEGIIMQARVAAKNERALISRSQFLDFRLKKDLARADFPAEVRKAMGEMTEAGYSTTRTINSLVHDVETSRLFDYAATNPRLSTSDPLLAAEKGWTKLSESTLLGRLSGKFVPESVADDILYIQRVTTDADRLYLKMLGAWKFAKVPLNPATHFRNLASNSMLLDFSGVPLYQQPGLVSVALEEMGSRGRWYQMAKQHGAFGGEFSQAEILDMFNKWNGTKGTMLERLVEIAGKHTGAAKIAKIYQQEEQVFKLAKFIHEMAYRGNGPGVAASEAQKWLFNYNAIPSAVKTARQAWWGSPFVTFQYKATPRVLETIVKRPLTFAKYPMLFEAVESYSIQKHGMSEKDVALAKKRRRGVIAPGLLPNFQYITPFKDKNNNVRVIDMAFTFPFGEVGEVGAFGKLMGFLGNPVLTTVIPGAQALITGEITDPVTNRTLKTFGEKSNFMANQLLPPLVPPAYAGKRIVSAAEGRTDYNGVPYDYWWEIMRNIFGVKTTAFVPQVERRRLHKRINGIEREFNGRMVGIRNDLSLTVQERQDAMREEAKRFKHEHQKLMIEFKLHRETEPSPPVEAEWESLRDSFD
jgi:hypothetical protein